MVNEIQIQALQGNIIWKNGIGKERSMAGTEVVEQIGKGESPTGREKDERAAVKIREKQCELEKSRKEKGKIEKESTKKSEKE